MPKRGSGLIFIKLGGSVMGDKRRAGSFRAAAIERIGREIAGFREAHPGARLLLGHGGGPAAHAAADRYRVRQGLPEGTWRGYWETRRAVLSSNRRVLDALARGGLHAVLVSPSAGCVARKGKAVRWDTSVLRRLLDAGQVPLIHGDVVLDETLGFTILSNEELFAFLAPKLKPERIVVTTDVEGVLRAPPRKGRRPETVPLIDESNLSEVLTNLGRAPRVRGRKDITGGMRSKIAALAAMARERGIESRVVSGLRAGCVRAALDGEPVGTLIR
jgi:isopentenyl phosphate kinase